MVGRWASDTSPEQVCPVITVNDTDQKDEQTEEQEQKPGLTGEVGNVKPSKHVTNVFTDVVKDVPEGEYGAVKEAADVALLMYLDAMAKGSQPDVVEYHSQREGWDFRDMVRDRLASIEHQELIPEAFLNEFTEEGDQGE
jgi:hypothetical protein